MAVSIIRRAATPVRAAGSEVGREREVHTGAPRSAGRGSRERLRQAEPQLQEQVVRHGDGAGQLDARGAQPRELAGAVTVTYNLLLQRSESTRLNSSHLVISYAVFCLKKKKKR